MIEQAIFTSAQTERSAGYQVVAKSPGVCEADARDLAVWCPSHDSLLESGPEASSVNFHPLSSGAYCVSRTIAAGWEYSGRGGHRVYTHCLIVSRETLAQFANNPFSLLRAAMAHGAVTARGEVPTPLEGFVLPGRAAAVDHALLSRLAANPGPLRMAMLVQAALESRCLAVFGPPSGEKLIAGLINCLPPECRTEFPFCTGLKYSSRRPFRLFGASGDPAEMRWLAHQPNVTVLDLSRAPPCSQGALDGWARLIFQLLAAGRTTLLASLLSKSRPDLTSADLPALALQLLEDFESLNLRSAFQPAPLVAASRKAEAREPAAAAQACQQPAEFADPPGETAEAPAAHDDAHPVGASAPEVPDRRAPRPFAATSAHGAHRKFAKTGQAEANGTAGDRASPRPRTHAEQADLCPEVMEQLEHLDDVVFDAIAGNARAMEELQLLWPQLLGQLGEEILAESREQYLRWALASLESRLDPQADYNPDRALQVVEVMCLLMENV